MSREQRQRSARERLRDSYEGAEAAPLEIDSGEVELGGEPAVRYEVSAGAAVALDDPLDALLDRIDAAPSALTALASYDGRKTPRRAAHDALYALLGMSGLEIQERREERDGNRVTAATLQREVRTRGKSSGGGGRNRRRKVVAFEPTAIPVDRPGREGPPPPRFRVYGLTRGSAEFYHRRPGTARAVLAAHVAAIVAGGRFPEPLEPAGGNAGRYRVDFEVYGLGHDQVLVLRADPGSARRALYDHAIAHDRARIAARDHQ